MCMPRSTGRSTKRRSRGGGTAQQKENARGSTRCRGKRIGISASTPAPTLCDEASAERVVYATVKGSAAAAFAISSLSPPLCVDDSITPQFRAMRLPFLRRFPEFLLSCDRAARYRVAFMTRLRQLPRQAARFPWRQNAGRTSGCETPGGTRRWGRRVNCYTALNTRILCGTMACRPFRYSYYE